MTNEASSLLSLAGSMSEERKLIAPSPFRHSSIRISSSIKILFFIAMPEVDFFNFFRWVLAVIVTIYATVVSLQILWGYLVWLSGADRYTGLLRRYLVLHGLRLRLRAFGGDLIVCALLCVVFLLLWRAHTIIHGIGDVLQDVR